jgi:AcrR family transcriptional regulator
MPTCWHKITLIRVSKSTHVGHQLLALVRLDLMKANEARPLANDHDATGALGVGGPRSEPTRRAILDAARAIFASRGYEQTTIRAVAGVAGIDASMVMRYFGSKAGLFTAAATVSLEPPDLRSVPVRRRGELLVRHFVDLWEGSPSGDTLVLLLRTAVTDDGVAEQVQADFDRLIAAPVAALGDPDADRRSALIATQLIGLAVSRYILRREPLASLPIDEIVADISPTIQRYLTHPMAGSSGPAPPS